MQCHLRASSTIFLLMLFCFNECTNSYSSVSGLPPAIPAAFLHLTIPEDAQVGHILTNLRLPSDDINALILYSINDDSEGYFFISSDGVLRLSRPLDREVTAVHEITVLVRSGEYPFQSSRVRIIIDVKDVSGSIPVFDQSELSLSIPEDHVVNTAVTTISATTQDSFPLFYSIVGGWGEDSFKMDGNRVVLVKPLRYNVRMFHRLIICASNGLSSSPSADTTLTVSVQDEPLSPEFSMNQYVFYVPSTSMNGNSDNNAMLGYVYATDRDQLCGVQSQSGLTYTINDTSVLQVDSVSGAISLVSSSLNQSVSVLVTVIDQSNHTDNAVITVNSAGNEMVPSVSLSSTSVQLSKNAPIGTVVARVTITNGSGEPGVIHGDCNQFLVNASSGEMVTTTTPLSVGSYSVVVGVKGFATVTEMLTVEITEENSPPHFDKQMYQLSVMENSPSGEVVYQFTATDPEGSEVKYSSGDLPSALSLSEDGRLTVKEDINRELNPEFEFSVAASDEESVSSEVGVVLKIMDENDNFPMFDSTQDFFEGVLTENQPPGTVITTIEAMDMDKDTNNGVISYSLIGSSEDLFYLTISPNGTVLSNYPVDYETKSSFVVTVRASDNGKPRRFVDKVLRVTVMNIPDKVPVFTDSDYTAIWVRATPTGTVLTTVRAIAEDNVTDIQYTLDNYTDLFTINEYTGDVSVRSDAVPSGIEDGDALVLTVSAINGGISTSIPVTITIGSMPTPSVYPRLFVVTEFAVFLPDSLALGDITLRGPSPQYHASLAPSQHGSEDYFILDNESQLLMLPSVVPGIHSLNISITADTGGSWFDVIEVRVSLLTNTSLTHPVTFSLPNLTPNQLSSHLLNTFLQAVSTRITCSVNQLQIVGIQASIKGTEISLLVFQRDLVSIMPKEQYMNDLVHNLWQLQSDFHWSVAIVDTSVCKEALCVGYQQCVTSSTLYLPRQQFSSMTLTVSSMPFTIQSSCTCPDGFNMNCTQLISQCDSNPCQYGGICRDLIDDYECECPAYTSGKNCSVVCPSTSCERCINNPCGHGAACVVEQNGLQRCACPDRGPLCEVTTGGFSGRGHIQVPVPVGEETELSIVFSFATVTPNGRIMYTGNSLGSRSLSVELVSGSLVVYIDIDGHTTQTTLTSRLGLLSNGEWHTVILEIGKQSVSVNVTGCTTSDSVILQDQEIMCQSQLQMPAEPFGILPFDSGVYFGGLPESFVPIIARPFDYYSGCMKDVSVARTLIDFSTVRKVGTVVEGCPEISNAGSCQEGCVSCVTGLWNGVTCNDTQESKSLNGSGYLKLVSSSVVTVQDFNFQLRTLQEDVALCQINPDTHLHISNGAVVFSHTPSSVALIANAFINDGYWHSINISVTPNYTQLSIDNGRVEVSAHQSILINTTEILIGGINGSRGVVKGLEGCVQGFKVNNDPVPSGESLFMMESEGALVGCSSDDLCTMSPCPNDSVCTNTWGGFTCDCHESSPLNNMCVDLCNVDACNLEGTNRCQWNQYGYNCVCEGDYTGTQCDFSPLITSCGKGYYSTTTTCKPCSCDLRGVTSDICSSVSGDCICAENTYSTSKISDLGCQPCECDPLGSVSLRCNDTDGWCVCKKGVGGRQCDTCLAGYAGFGEQGCHDASVIEGSFTVENLYCGIDTMMTDSTALENRILNELKQFSLPSTQELRLTISQENSTNVAVVDYVLSAYLPQENTVLTLPTPHLLATVMQSIVKTGRLDVYHLTPDSHAVTSDCSVNPCQTGTNCTNTEGGVVCSGCPSDTVLDGVVCKPVIPMNCSGTDSDLDGVPDACDVCPYDFNPEQKYTSNGGCGTSDEGVCPNNGAEGILWTITEAGLANYKDCPAPLIGTAVRVCNTSGVWMEPDLTQCYSRYGEEMRSIVSSVTSAPPTNRNETVDLVQYFHSLVESNQSPTIADLMVSHTLLNSLIKLDTILPLGEDNLTPLGDVINNLVAEDKMELWSTISPNGTSGILATVEEIGELSAKSFRGNFNLEMENLNMMVTMERVFDGVDYEIDSMIENSVDIAKGVVDNTDSVGVSIVNFPNLVHSLPRPSFRNISFGAPVWSIKLAVNGSTGVSVLDTPINITFTNISPLDYVSLDSVICATWDTQTLDWVQDGCEPVVVTANHTVCSCVHLSSFTLLQNLSVEAPPLSVEQTQTYSPALVGTILFIVSCLILVVSIVILMVLCCKSQKERSFIEIWFQLLLSVLLFLILFIAGPYLTDSGSVCAVVGLLLAYFPLVAFSLFLIGGITVIMKQKWFNTIVMKLIASVIAWVFPLLYTVVCGVILNWASTLSFTESLGYPEYCWINIQYSFLFFPIPFILVPSVVMFMIIMFQHHCMTKQSSPNQPSKHHSLFAIHFFIILSVFLPLWLLIACAVYTTSMDSTLHTVLQYLAAIVALVFSIVVLIIVLLKMGLNEFIRFKLHMSTSIELLEMKRSSYNNSSINSRTPFRRRRSSLPSLPGEDEPEYHTIAAIPRVPPALPNHHPMHMIQVENTNEGATNLMHSSDSDNDIEVEHILSREAEEDVMMANEGYGGVMMPHLRVPNPPVAIERQTEEETEDNEEVTEIDSQWFKEGTTCSPIHQPFSFSSSTIMTPLPTNRTATADEEAEIDKLYQLTRIGNRLTPDDYSIKNDSMQNVYAEIRSPSKVDTSTSAFPPSYDSCAVSNSPWYKTADSEVNYSVSNTHQEIPSSFDENDVIIRSRPSPPPAIPPQLPESPPTISGGTQLYAEIDTIQPLMPPPNQRPSSFNVQQQPSVVNRCSSLSQVNQRNMDTGVIHSPGTTVRPLRSSVATMSPTSPSSRPSYPNGSLDRRSGSNPHQRRMTTGNIGNHSHSQQHVVQNLNNGSQTFQSLV